MTSIANILPAIQSDPQYVLITAARNEEAFISATLDAVAEQTIPPTKWIICLNDSDDKTTEIVAQYAHQLPFLTTIHLKLGTTRSFANKAVAIEAGFAKVSSLPFDYLGILDADISFDPQYYELLIDKFRQCPHLGIAVGNHIERYRNGKQRILSQPTNIAVGGTQFFRRSCIEQIKGYRSLQWGGIDTLAGVMARMYGWQTKTFEDIGYNHQRQMGTEGMKHVLWSRICYGIRGRQLGMHPIYAIAKLIRRVFESPMFLNTLSWFMGYGIALAMPKDYTIPRDCKLFFRSEQLSRLRSVLRSKEKDSKKQSSEL